MTDNTDFTKRTEKLERNSETRDVTSISEINDDVVNKDETNRNNEMIGTFTTDISNDVSNNVKTNVNDDKIDDVLSSQEKSVFNMDILFPHLEKVCSIKLVSLLLAVGYLE